MKTKKFFVFIFCLIISVQFLSIQVLAVEVGANTNSSANKYSSDWRYWSQGATQYVNSKMQSSGCRVVAQAKLLVEAGIESGNSSFNPDTYIVWAHNNKHFGDNRPFTSYIGEQTGGKAPVAYAASKGKNLTYHGQVSFSSNDVTTQNAVIMDYLNKGYFIILGNSTHHVYVGRSASLDAKTPVLFNSSSAYSNSDSLIIKYTDYIAKGKAPFSYIRLYSTSNTPGIETFSTKVTTNAATNITATSAQLNGSLSANSSVNITEHGAYLGTSTSNMTRVAKDTVNYNRSSLTMFYSTSKYGTTLKPGTTYYFYQYAVIDGKTVKGETLSFTTPSVAPSVPVISINTTSISEGETAILTWVDVPNSSEYDVQILNMSTSSATISLFAKSPYTISDLAAGIYQITVTALGNGGSSGPSNVIMLTVNPKTTVPDPPVISISATSITEGETATLTWADVPNSTEYSLHIEDVSSTWGGAMISPFAKSPYTISDLAAGVYQITVTALGNGGSSGPSNVITLIVQSKESTGGITPRTTAPNTSNSYYYSSKNPFYSAYVGQCTWYAYGRAYELLGSKPNLSTGNAGTWYDYNKQYNYYPYGSTPQIGAIACIKNSGVGHVAVVEDIINGQPVFSEYNVNSDKSFHYGRNITSTIVGYIYILDNGGTNESTSKGTISGTNGALSIRQGPGTNYEQIGRIPEGATCTVYTDKTSGSWYYVEYNGVKGYASKNYIKLESSSSTARIGTVGGTNGALAIRSGAGTSYTQIGRIPERATCTVYTDKTSGNWYYVEYNGVKGYAHKSYIKLN